MAIDEKVLAGRALVEKYRANHDGIYAAKRDPSFAGKSAAQKRAINNAVRGGHMPLLTQLLKDLGRAGFASLKEFYTASYQADEAEKIPVEEWWQ